MATLLNLNVNTKLMLGVCPMLEFYSNPPPALFQGKYENGIKRIYQNDDRMNVFIQSPGYQGYFPNTNGGVITVEKYEEVEAWAEMLLSKPSLLDVHCRRANTKNDNSEADQIIRDGYFAVIVNPNNPQIKGQIEKALDEARSAMKAGKKFVLTFDVRNAISDWFIQNVKADVRCQYGRLFVTNHYVYQDIEDKFCGTTVEKIVCCGCFLCACCLYTFHRLILCSNISLDVTGQVIQINLEPENTTVIGDSTEKVRS